MSIFNSTNNLFSSQSSMTDSILMNMGNPNLFNTQNFSMPTSLFDTGMTNLFPPMTQSVSNSGIGSNIDEILSRNLSPPTPFPFQAIQSITIPASQASMVNALGSCASIFGGTNGTIPPYPITPTPVGSNTPTPPVATGDPVPTNNVPERVINTSGDFQPKSMTGRAFQSTILPLYGFTGSVGDDALAIKLIKDVEKMYAADPDFKRAIDGLIAKYGYITVTTNELGGNTAGLATVGGNEVIIDTQTAQSNDNAEVIAHEFGHNTGLEHGAALDNFVAIATDKK